jgi:TatD DNase family protein
MRIIDVHSHLDMPEFAADLPRVVERAIRAGVEVMICVGTDLASSRACVELARRFPGRLYAAVGIHPNSWSQAGPEDMRGIERLCALPEVVAVGETGLDFHHALTDRRGQAAGFVEHIRVARSARKPLMVHARKSDEHVLAILAREAVGPGGAADLPGVRHCFDGSADIAARYVEQGLHISFGGLITRPGHDKVKQAARTVPAGRLLIETDCPYQTPALHAGERNEPAYALETLQALAALRGETPEALANSTTRNAEALFLQRSSP